MMDRFSDLPNGFLLSCPLTSFLQFHVKVHTVTTANPTAFVRTIPRATTLQEYAIVRRVGLAPSATKHVARGSMVSSVMRDACVRTRLHVITCLEHAHACLVTRVISAKACAQVSFSMVNKLNLNKSIAIAWQIMNLLNSNCAEKGSLPLTYFV